MPCLGVRFLTDEAFTCTSKQSNTCQLPASTRQNELTGVRLDKKYERTIKVSRYVSLVQTMYGLFARELHARWYKSVRRIQGT